MNNVVIGAVLAQEGYWSNNPNDPGGATMFGISSRYNPEYKTDIVNKTLTPMDAISIAYKKYLIKYGLDKFNYDHMKYFLLDTYFNGSYFYGKAIRDVLREMGYYTPVGGHTLGPKTRAILNSLNEKQCDTFYKTIMLRSERLSADWALWRKLPQFKKGIHRRFLLRAYYAYTRSYVDIGNEFLSFSAIKVAKLNDHYFRKALNMEESHNV